LGLSGPIPTRVDQVTKAGLLVLVEGAVAGGWSTAGACRYLELSKRRYERWRRRAETGNLIDRVPGGPPLHRITPGEEAEILAVFEEWAEVDRSHRKLAHRGSWLGRFWCAPSTVRRVLDRHDLRFRTNRRSPKREKKPWPGWVDDQSPNRIWIYDTTHWTTAEAATTVIEDVVTRKWVADITSADETSIEVQAAFTRAIRDEGLTELIDAVNPDGTVAYDPDNNERLPVLLVMSDNGPQMTSGSTREFLALNWLATHYGRPGTPTDQAWIESLFGHLKNEWPHLEQITDIGVLRAELKIRREHYNTVRLHAGLGYVTPDQAHTGKGPLIRAARTTGLAWAKKRRITYNRNNHKNRADHAV